MVILETMVTLYHLSFNEVSVGVLASYFCFSNDTIDSLRVHIWSVFENEIKEKVPIVKHSISTSRFQESLMQ